MFEEEREQFRKNYQLCRLGFGITAVGLVLACIDSLLGLFGKLQPHFFTSLTDSPWYVWLQTPITWCPLFGVSLLRGAWDQTSWRRRSSLLLLMCMADLGLWFFSRGESLGLPFGHDNHSWLRAHMGDALGWSQFALLSSLSGVYLAHLGVEQARDSDKATRSMVVTGAALWMIQFCQQTNWAAGWPLQPRRLGLEWFLLQHGWSLIWTIILIQVTGLVLSAARQTRHVLDEMAREDQANDPFGPYSKEQVGARGSSYRLLSLPDRSARRQQLAQRLRQRKVDALFANCLLLDRRPVVALEVVDAILHDLLGGAAPAVMRTVSTF